LPLLKEALAILFSQVVDTYYRLDLRGEFYASLKQLSDSDVLTLAVLT
jgi:hypothetical protein